MVEQILWNNGGGVTELFEAALAPMEGAIRIIQAAAQDRSDDLAREKILVACRSLEQDLGTISESTQKWRDERQMEPFEGLVEDFAKNHPRQFVQPA